MKNFTVKISLPALVILAGLVWWAARHRASPPTAPVTLEGPAVPVVHPELATGTPLAEAYAMAAFMGKVHDGMPTNEMAIRGHLEGLQVAWFLSDYVMASKSNADVALTVAAVTKAFANVSTNGAEMLARLPTYAIRDGTLADHYRDTMRDSKNGPAFTAITNAMQANAVPVDLDNDLLMDCLRYTYFMTSKREFYGPNSDHYYPEAMQAYQAIAETTFGHRFTERFGLSRETASNLMASLRRVDAPDFTPATMQVPAKFK